MTELKYQVGMTGMVAHRNLRQEVLSVRLALAVQQALLYN